MAKAPKIPTADEEALQQPTIDPIMLLASIMSGGIGGFQNASAEQSALEALRGAIIKNPAEYENAAPEFLANIEKDIPVLGKTIMDALGGGMNFASGATMNHQMMPNHPLLSNMLAMPIVPAGAISNAGDSVENWLLKNHPGIQDILGRLKPLAAAPLLLRDTDKKNGR